MESIVISGIGILSSIGDSLESHLRVLQGESLELEVEEGRFNTIVKKVGNINVKKCVKNKKSIRFFSKQTKIGCYCAKMAKDDAELEDEEIQKKERMNALVIGSGYSQSLLPSADALVDCTDLETGIIDYNKVGEDGYRMLSPLWILSRLPNTTAGQITIENGIKGFNYTVVNGINSGIVSVGEAFLSIRQKRAVRVFCGGVEDEILPDFIYELQKDRLLADSSDGTRIFGTESDGFTAGEGGCILILEAEEEANFRHADIYGEVLGYSNLYIPNINEIKDTCEIAHHMERVMEKAMKMAGVRKEDIDFIQASAGGNSLLDHSEAEAVEAIFSNQVYITAAQSYVGNTMAASGALSAAFACIQLHNNFIAPILGTEDFFLADKLRYVKDRPMEHKSKLCLVNAFSHLGEVCTLVIGKR